jgi:hypothetical protein
MATRKIKFTKPVLLGLPVPERGRDYYYDESLPNLGLCVTYGGTRSFHVKATMRGQTRRIAISNGKFPGMDILVARASARAMLADISANINPVEVKRGRKAMSDEAREAREASRERGILLGEVLKECLGMRKEKQKATYQRHFRRHIENEFGHLLKKPMIDITEDVVIAVYTERGKKCNNGMKYLGILFNYAKARYKREGTPIFSINPVDVLDKLNVKQEYKRRTKAIPVDELPAWFDAVEALEDRKDREYFIFLILTGARGGMTYDHLTWDKVDFENHTFIMKEKMGTDDVRLPLPEFIENLIKDRTNDTGPKGKVFPTAYDDGQAIIAAIEKAIGTRYTRHDLRRTFQTVAKAAKIAKDVRQELMEHKRDKSSTTEQYVIDELVQGYCDDDEELPIVLASRKIEATILRKAGRQVGAVISFPKNKHK